MILELHGDTDALRKIYNAINAELNVAGAAPAGLISHVAGPIPSGWRIVDVWQSKAAFDAFGTRLFPVAAKLGMSPDTQPDIWEIESTIKGA
jgi:hypothetical protein